MEGLFRRLLTAWMAMAGGALLGMLLGGTAQAPLAGSIVGALAGVAVAVLVDARRAERLAHWLRDPHGSVSPRDKGFWGELAYRADKLVRMLERQAADERQHLAQFLSAIEASPNGVLLLDPDDQIEWCNPMAAMHLGLDAVRDRGQPITNLVRMPGFVALLQAEAPGKPAAMTAPDGDTMLAISVRRYAGDRRLLMTQDITERMRTDAMRRDFVANVSHEIRSPLTVLAGFIETMGSVPLTVAERERVLQLMKQQTDRMQALVSDLLALAQLEGSPRPPLDRWVSVPDLVRRIESDARALSGGRHVLDFEPPPEGLAVAGQESELVSALGNLVSNAVRYTPNQGRVAVRWIDRADGGGELEVSDTGIGIDAAHLPRLAERFYRVDQSRSRETGGTGLGLAIAKHAVQRHGGELDIESELGKGSRFRLVIPPGRIRRAAHAPAARAGEPAALQGVARR